MALFNRTGRKGSLMDEIRCDESEYLIWKWHPKGTTSGNNSRENAIRWGSSLRVKPGEAAAFMSTQYDGRILDIIYGPFDDFLETENLPGIADIIGLAYDGGTPFQAEIYFFNLAKIIQVKFGVPFFDVYDPRYGDYSVPVAVRGTLSFRITDCNDFISLHGLRNFSLEDFQKEIKDVVCRYVKDAVMNAPAANNIPVVQLESKLSLINDTVEYDIRQRLSDSFGVTVTGVDINAIEIDKSSDGYYQLMSVTRNLTGDALKAESEAKIRDIADKQQANAEHYRESLRIERQEAEYLRRKQTQASYFDAYKVEAQTQVGVAGAQALGQMGANNAGSVDLGGAGSGFNPVAMTAGIALGGAVGQNIAGVINNAMTGASQTTQQSVTPPPIPSSSYYIAVNGQPTGPFDIATLGQMANAGQLTADNLVWKNGMEQWVKAKSVEELKGLFIIIPPIPSE